MFGTIDLLTSEQRLQAALGEITLSFWRHGRPGPARIARMAATAPTTPHDRVERIGAWDKVIAWAQAHQCAEIADYVEDTAHAAAAEPRGFSVEDAITSAEAEIALILRTTTRTAGMRADDARELAHRYPHTRTALMDGQITLSQARAILDGGLDLDDAQAHALEDQVLGRAKRQTLGQLRESVRRAVLRIEPDAAERRHRRKRRERKVVLYPERDGMATLAATLPAAEAVGVYAVLDQHARACHNEGLSGDGDRRSMDARRADTLVDLVLSETGFASSGAEPTFAPIGADTEIPTADSADASDHATSAETDARARNRHQPGASEPDAAGPGSAEPGAAATDAAQPDAAQPDAAQSDAAQPGAAAESMPPNNRDRIAWGRWLTSRYRRTRAAAVAQQAAGPPDRRRMPALAPPCRPTGPTRVHVQVRVTVPLDVLTGHSEAPAELGGYGPVSATVARELAADPDSTWQRLVTDPLTGSLLDHGTTRYRPPAGLREHVIARHQTCQFPGCRTPAHRCDLDHNIPFDPAADTGPTSAANLGPKCRPHHQLKGLPGWDVRQYRDGTIVWHTPSGHTYTVEPPPLTSPAPTRPPPPVEDDAPPPF